MTQNHRLRSGSTPGQPESTEEADATYDVGYGKPPVNTRFRKGQSGNPHGRPRGARSASTILNAALKSKGVRA